MNRNKERSVSIVNVILIILIALACAVIYFLMRDGDNIDVAETDNTTITYTPSGNSNESITPTPTQTTNVALSNDILQEKNVTETNTTAPATHNLDSYKFFFYSQLDDKAKVLYSAIINNVDSLKNGYKEITIASGNEDISGRFQTCWDAFSMDKPEIFYVDTKKVSLVTQTSSGLLSGTKYELTLQPQSSGSYFLDCWTTEEQVQNAIKQVESVANTIINRTSSYSSTYDKVKYVHDYIIENADYDKTKDINNADIYGLLIKHKAVCEGYAKAFKYLLDKMGIPCVVICGNGYSDDGTSEFHAWNYVLMDDNNWYAVDTTWDDPIVIGNGRLSDDAKHRYFLVGSNSFSKNHIEDGDVSGTGQTFKYPRISKSDYPRR